MLMSLVFVVIVVLWNFWLFFGVYFWNKKGHPQSWYAEAFIVLFTGTKGPPEKQPLALALAHYS